MTARIDALALTLLMLLSAVVPIAAQSPLPLQPAPPAKYKVVLRYDMQAARDQHVVLYDALIAHLQRLDFAFDPPLADRPNTDREDPGKNRMQGTVAPDQALKLLANESVAAVLLVPDDFKLPEEADQPVHVRLQLASGFPVDRQREFAEQAVVLLRQVGFQEATGYDPRGYDRRPFSRLVGTIPAGRLDTLLKDLRSQPSGWLAPGITAADLPSPIRLVNPVRFIEVLKDTGPLKEPAPPGPRTTASQEKIAPELWELVKQKESQDASVRVQVVFAGTPGADRGWSRALEAAAPGFFTEGQLGQFVTGITTLGQVGDIAAIPFVSAVRLPRTTRPDVEPAIKPTGNNAQVLAQSGVAALHARGQKGRGVRLAIIDTDFRGWEALVRNKQLPAGTRLVDLTTERDPEIRPAPYAADDQPGHGTLCAQAAALAAPEAALTLIRLDAVAPYQIQEVTRYLQGGLVSPLIERRRDELTELHAVLEHKRGELLKERDAILDNFTDETDLVDDFGFLGPMLGWLYSDRAWHLARMDYQEKLEKALRARDVRFSAFLADVRGLRGIQVVASPLTWHSGYPAGSGSPLSRSLEALPTDGPLWFQAAGNVAGQSWVGSFNTFAGGPALEFAEPGTPLPAGRWSTSLNFLAWQPHEGERKPDLPEKTQVKLSVQWREPHDPEFYLQPGEEDLYLRPLATLRVVLLRQRDPEAKETPADAFDVVARSTGLPQRLQHLPNGSVYEIGLDVALDQPGRYAVRIERQRDQQWSLGKHPVRTDQPALQQLRDLNPTGLRPLGSATLPALDKSWDLRPGLFVETIDEPHRRQGRAVLDFHTSTGSIGIPVDSRGVISVGAVDLKDQPRPYSAAGAPAQAELQRLPTLWSYDALELAGGGAFGTSIANAYAAGATAALLSSGLSREEALRWLGARPGQVLRVAER